MKRLRSLMLGAALVAAFSCSALAQSWTAPGQATSTGYPVGSTPLAVSVNASAAAATATLPASVGRITYICGFFIGSNATAATFTAATVTGVLGGTMSFMQGTATAPAVTILQQNFSPCIPASANNTALAVVSGSPGAGGFVYVNAWGYQF